MDRSNSDANEVRSSLNHDDVELESIDPGYQGFFRIDKIRLKHKLFAGGWTESFTRELFERGEAVCVLLFDPNKNRIVLTEQFRIGALKRKNTPWLLELVAGMVEDGESPEEVAIRETEEEAGCAFKKLIPIHSYLVSPGGTSERIHLYCGLLDSEGVGGIHGLEHENEDIRLVVVPFEQAWSWVESGEIDNAAAIIALQWLKMNRDSLTL